MKGKTKICIELKERNCLPLLYEDLKKTGPWGNSDIIFIAFDEDEKVEGGDSTWSDLAELKSHSPNFNLGLLFTPRKILRGQNLNIICQKAADLQALAIIPFPYQFVSTTIINFVHTNFRNLKIFTCVVDSKKEIEKFRAWGIDGLASNYPDLLN